MWLTLQRRLPTEFYRAGCDTVEAANAFLVDYVERFNKQFAVEPMRPESFFLPCLVNLDVVLTAQIPRRTDPRLYLVSLVQVRNRRAPRMLPRLCAPRFRGRYFCALSGRR